MSILKDKSPSSTPISKYGEFGLINHLSSQFKCTLSSTKRGIGDDAAVLEFTEEKYHLLSTDMLVEGVHFDLSYTPLKHLGFKAISVNVSDICAMNGIPSQITVSIAVSNRFPVEALEELYAGIYTACREYNVDLVGGDTTTSISGLVISISILGEVDKQKITYRSGANINDLVVVTGDLGAAFLGLNVLKREKKVFLENPGSQPDLGGNDYSLQRQLKTEARLNFVRVLDELKIVPTSMIDVSDGLSSEILHLSKNSEIGITVYEEKLPIDYTTMNLASDMNLDPIFCAMNGGEDYELLFTMSQKHYEKIKKDVDFTIIGHVTDISSGNNFIAKDHTSHKITAHGWDPLLKKDD